jgi:hypothetical protein
MAMKSQTQRALLFAFIGSIICCAMAGIYCLLVGRMSPLQAKILGTTGVFGAASILGLASAIPWERRRWHPIGLVGLIVVAIAVFLVLFAIWLEPPWREFELFFKIMFIACVAAVAVPHAGLLGLARLRRGYEWVRLATVFVIALLAGQISLSILTEIDEEEWYRFMGVLGILTVSGTLAVPILHRISGIRAHEDIQTSVLLLSLTCPRCQRVQQLPVGRSKCAGCGLSFSIEIEEAHCARCGYPLYKLRSSVCPECGTPISSVSEAG